MPEGYYLENIIAPPVGSNDGATGNSNIDQITTSVGSNDVALVTKQIDNTYTH